MPRIPSHADLPGVQRPRRRLDAASERCLMIPKYFLQWVVVVGMLTPAGCGGPGDELPRQAVSGSVTLKGQPLPQGTIQFLPTTDKQPTAGAVEIKDGKYSLPREQGLVPGSYKVMISSVKDPGAQQGPDDLPGKPGPPSKDLIAAKYNVKTNLTAEVKEGAANTLAFPPD